MLAKIFVVVALAVLATSAAAALPKPYWPDTFMANISKTAQVRCLAGFFLSVRCGCVLRPGGGHPSILSPHLIGGGGMLFFLCRLLQQGLLVASGP